jgi:hypothetical protein
MTVFAAVVTDGFLSSLRIIIILLIIMPVLFLLLFITSRILQSVTPMGMMFRGDVQGEPLTTMK